MSASAAQFADLVSASAKVARTSARTEKRALIAALLREVRPDDLEPAVSYLIGEPRQGRGGVGWATLSKLNATPATRPNLSIADVDVAIDRVFAITGAGSVDARARLLHDLFRRATASEQTFLTHLLGGELRQGANAGVMTDAIANAASVPAAAVRRAAMLSGDLPRTARIALVDGRTGLDAVSLEPGRPVQPMLAGTSESVGDAIGDLRTVSVEWKLDGARVQVHRLGDEVRVFTRNLNDVTDRLPEVVRVARALPSRRFVLDGETLAITDDARPARFQDSMSTFGRVGGAELPRLLRPFFFDALHLDGDDLIDRSLAERRDALIELAGDFVIPGIVTADAAEAGEFAEAALDAGHEGVMVKSLEAPYVAGRRGKTWRKVKPVRTLDLVVLAAEWGHGRRTGWLSNIHLGARQAGAGSFVMVGKTFKGLTDALLEWQTGQFLAREIGRDGITVHLRPEMVVEIALDGVQASSRYPGGVALRFARVKRYRPDKSSVHADTIDTVRSLLAGSVPR